MMRLFRAKPECKGIHLLSGKFVLNSKVLCSHTHGRFHVKVCQGSPHAVFKLGISAQLWFTKKKRNFNVKYGEYKPRIEDDHSLSHQNEHPEQKRVQQTCCQCRRQEQCWHHREVCRGIRLQLTENLKNDQIAF
jgi:hypothetical protein